MTRRLLIDTDTASDDAVALIMALQSPAVAVEAITIVSGNVPVAQGSRNARFTVELCGAQVPVYEGLKKPLLRPVHHAHFFHGPDGLGGMNYPEPRTPPAGTDAVGELIRRARQAPGELELVTLGPLTNLAAALIQEPRLARWLRRAVVMGGAACTVGNITPAAEYNIWCDPEAAQIVFSSGLELLMVGWEHCRGAAALSDAEIQAIYALNTPRARFAMDCNRTALEASRQWLGDAGLQLPDPVAMAVALEPTVCLEKSRHHVEVSCDERLTRGMTVVDRLGVTEQLANVEVCWRIDVPRWKALLVEALR